MREPCHLSWPWRSWEEKKLIVGAVPQLETDHHQPVLTTIMQFWSGLGSVVLGCFRLGCVVDFRLDLVWLGFVVIGCFGFVVVWLSCVMLCWVGLGWV